MARQVWQSDTDEALAREVVPSGGRRVRVRRSDHLGVTKPGWEASGDSVANTAYGQYGGTLEYGVPQYGG